MNRLVGTLATRLAGYTKVERSDRADGQLDHLGRDRPARRRTQGSGEDDPLHQGAAGQERRLVVVRERPGRLERHRGRDPGAARRRRLEAREDDHARPRLSPAPPEQGRRLRADAEPRLGRAVDRVGDPGVRRRGKEAREAGLPLPPAPPARRTAATATTASTRRAPCGRPPRSSPLSLAVRFPCGNTRPMDATVLTVGNEIVSGDTENTNASWLSRRLAVLGVRVTFVAAVRDDVEEIGAFIRGRRAQTDFVFVTGGLGGTPDDVTREGVAAAFRRRVHRDRAARRRVARALRPARPRRVRGALGPPARGRGAARQSARRRSRVPRRERLRPSWPAERDARDVRRDRRAVPRHPDRVAAANRAGDRGPDSSRCSRRRPRSIPRSPSGATRTSARTGPRSRSSSSRPTRRRSRRRACRSEPR